MSWHFNVSYHKTETIRNVCLLRDGEENCLSQSSQNPKPFDKNETEIYCLTCISIEVRFIYFNLDTFFLFLLYYKKFNVKFFI